MPRWGDDTGYFVLYDLPQRPVVMKFISPTVCKCSGSLWIMDAELKHLRARPTNWGGRLPTRVLIRILIAHDVYHAGEINHIRALLRGTDRWPYE